MPVTTRIITELSGSSRKPQSIWNEASCPLDMWNGSPAIQVNWITSRTLCACCASCHTAPAEKRNESRIIPGQIRSMRNLSGEWWLCPCSAACP